MGSQVSVRVFGRPAGERDADSFQSTISKPCRERTKRGYSAITSNCVSSSYSQVDHVLGDQTDAVVCDPVDCRRACCALELVD